MMNLLTNCPFCNHTLKNLEDNKRYLSRMEYFYDQKIVNNNITCFYKDCKFENYPRFIQNKIYPNRIFCVLKIKNIFYKINVDEMRLINIEIVNCTTGEVGYANIKKLEFNSIQDLENEVRKFLLNVFK